MPAAAPPALSTGTAAVVDPAAPGDLYVPALARHGWRSVAVTGPDRQQNDTAGYVQHVTHRGSLRRTAQRLRDLGVSAVVAGSPAGTEVADQLAARLDLPGNDPATAHIRRDTGWTTTTLLDAGITAPRHIRATRLPDALAWAAFTHIREFVIEHPDPAHPVPPYYCRTPDDIAAGWHHLQQTSSQPLILREHFTGTQYCIHTMSRSTRHGGAEHIITAIWSGRRASSQLVGRSDLLSLKGLLARALSLYMTRALNALGVRYGPAHATVTFIPDRGPALLSLRTDPHADFATEVLRHATGGDPIEGTTLLIATGRLPQPQQPRCTHVTKIALLPQRDGAIDSALLRTITTLPTVAATTPLRPGAAVRGGDIAGWLLLIADDSRAINQDHHLVRTTEHLGLYRRHV
jgi:hypothetical protein